MKLILRDDDINYFTDPEFIERTYGDIMKKQPIHCAVIPYVSHQAIGVFDLYKKVKPGTYPIHKNKKLVAYLKKKIKLKQIVIWMHGITHAETVRQQDFECVNVLPVSKLKKAKQYLEKTFGTSVDTFVAPHDQFSKQTVVNIKKSGFKAINRGVGPQPREWSASDMPKIIRFMAYYHKNKSKRYPVPVVFNGIEQFFSYRVEELKDNKLEHVIAPVTTITMHHRTFSQTHKEMVLKLCTLQ